MAHNGKIFQRPIDPIDFPIHYLSGICVVATTFHIPIKEVSLGNDSDLDGYVLLQPIGAWCDLDVGLNSLKAMKVENYVTCLLAGSAASYLRVQDQRCHLKRSLGNAGLEMRFLREIWQSLRREPDRAIAIICGSLGEYDDGDVEATAKRLWHRAVRILGQPRHRVELNTLIRELAALKKMSGDDINEVLSHS